MVLVFSCNKTKGWRSRFFFFLKCDLGSGFQFPSLVENRCLSPVVLLSHYVCGGWKVELAPVSIPQWLLKKQKGEEAVWGNTNVSHKNEREKKISIASNGKVLWEFLFAHKLPVNWKWCAWLSFLLLYSCCISINFWDFILLTFFLHLLCNDNNKLFK